MPTWLGNPFTWFVSSAAEIILPHRHWRLCPELIYAKRIR